MKYRNYKPLAHTNRLRRRRPNTQNISPISKLIHDIVLRLQPPIPINNPHFPFISFFHPFSSSRLFVCLNISNEHIFQIYLFLCIIFFSHARQPLSSLLFVTRNRPILIVMTSQPELEHFANDLDDVLRCYMHLFTMTNKYVHDINVEQSQYSQEIVWVDEQLMERLKTFQHLDDKCNCTHFSNLLNHFVLLLFNG